MRNHDRHVRRIALLVLLGTTFSTADVKPPATRPATDVALATADGRTITPLALGGNDKAAVVVFVAIGCPICNASAPTLAALAKSFASRGVAFYVVYTDGDLKADDVLKHQAEYALPGTALLDPAQTLAAALGASITPTAFVIEPGGRICYKGAIDDAFAAVGRKRFAPTKHYVADALNALLAGKPIEVKQTTPVGCEL